MADKKLLTLCIAHEHPKILLAMKKRGFGTGKWNGLGGKVEEGETIEQAAIRESREEAGITINKMEKLGILDFEFKGDPVILEVHIFKINNFEGEPEETEEMKPQWFHTDDIPLRDMWPDDEHWLPLFLDGKKFKGKFLFEGDDNETTIIEHLLEEVEEI